MWLISGPAFIQSHFQFLFFLFEVSFYVYDLCWYFYTEIETADMFTRHILTHLNRSRQTEENEVEGRHLVDWLHINIY